MISVIIPAYNEEKVIKRTINSILKSNYNDYEIIVVDNGSTDSTVNVVKNIKSDKIRLFKYTRKKGPAYARNYGAKKARGNILFFLDADDFLKKKSLINTKKLFDKYNPKAIAYNRIAIKPRNWRRIWVYKFLNSWGRKFKTELSKDFSGCPYVFNKKFFKELGGFTSSYYFEDYLLQEKIKKLGVKVLTTNKITVYSDMGASFNDFFKRSRNVGVGIVKSRLYKKLLKNLVIMGVLVYLLLNPLLYLVFYFLYGLNFFIKSKDKLIMISSPLLFTLDKIITDYYLIITIIKSLI